MSAFIRTGSLVLFFALVGAGCRPAVPGAFADRYEDIKTEVAAARTETDVTTNRWTRLSKGEPYAALSTRLGSPAAAERAKAAILAAEKLTNDDLRKAANLKDNAEAEKTFAQVLGQIEDQLEVAEDTLERPNRIFRSVPLLQQNAQEAAPEATRARETALAVVLAARKAVPGAQEKHPGKREDLANRLAKLEERGTKVDAAAKMVPLTSDLVDLAMFYDDAVEGSKVVVAEGGDLQSRITQLDREYSKTLIDMKADFTATFTRWSWDNMSDYNTEATYTYAPRLLSPEQYERLVSTGSNKLSPETLGALGIDTFEQMPSGHGDYEIFTEEVTAKYYHKYLNAEKGRATQTEWEEVSPALFLRNIENLGMDILFKPFGKYEDEAQSMAAPPGYYHVGNPAYGRWEGTGKDRTWIWLPLFLPFYSPLYLGSPLYYRDWDGWSRGYRGKRSYYGPRRGDDNSFGTYVPGGYSAGTYWGSIGGTSRQSATVRGVGSSFRGGGPGGGGK